MSNQEEPSACEIRIFARVLDDNARDQINQLAHHPALKGPVAIMPDAHAGAGCVIGFTGRFHEAVIPNIVGVDIGCGVAAYRLSGLAAPDYHKLDNFIRRNIPLGMSSRKDDRVFGQKSILEAKAGAWMELCDRMEKGFFGEYGIGRHTSPALQLGTLGGGNHFIEVDRGHQGDLYLLIHSGSRNFGLRVAEFFQKRAQEFTRKKRIQVPSGAEFLPMKNGGDEYVHWAQMAQTYARYNRQAMLFLMLDFLGCSFEEKQFIESVHNYISPVDQIVRKGAISARSSERVVVPLNMADGTIIGRGKSNPAYNFSAPHGAGRMHGRQEMKRMLAAGTLSMQQFQSSMTHVYSTSISRNTIDESKFAYKPFEAIREFLEETVEIEDHLTPVYNLKAGDG